MTFSSFKSQDKIQAAFYEALSGKSENALDKVITDLGEEGASGKVQAYKGALLMKKAEFMKGAGNKLKIFKKGASMLEDEIKQKPGNVEFRFIRLVIQEHAPKILKYNTQIKEDKRMVVDGYKSLDASLKKVINNYSNSSTVIKNEDLK